MISHDLKHHTNKHHTSKKPSRKHRQKKHTKKKISNSIINKIEFTVLMHIITEQMLFLIKIKTPKHKIKKTILLLLNEVRSNNKLIKNTITDDELNIIFNTIYKYSIMINKKNSKPHNSKYTGGFYFKNIEEKGDEPVTGNDIAKLLDEMQAFFYNAQYTDEGRFVKDPNTLMSMFRGDTDSFKFYVMYTILPQYVTMFPPFFNWENIRKAFENKKYEDLPDYLLAYQTYMRSRDEYLVEKGLKSPDVLNKDLYTGFYNKLAHSLDTNVTKFQQFRNKITGKAPITFPV